jgi:hypothetical protein
MAEKLFGQATIKWDGNVLDTLKGATLNPGGIKRTTVKGSKRVLGFTEEVMESKLDCEVAVGSGFSASELNGVTSATVTFATDTGQTWVMRGAWSTDPNEITEADGKAKVSFEGPPAEEML